MKGRYITQIGGILFFIGIILIIISWHYSYPISISPINEETFFKFPFLIWPGIVSSLIGLFLVGFYSKSKIVKATCSSIFPLVLYITHFFFNYISSSDCGTARGMFQVFHMTGINHDIIPYFEFPTYFSFNEIIHQTTALDEKGIAFFSYALYGILLGLFLFLFFLNLKKKYTIQLIPSLLVIIYFFVVFPFLNYQWVPQTLALIYFFILIFLTTYMISDSTEYKWKFMFILIFIMLVLTHAFISVFFILFFCFLTLKKRYLLPILLVIVSIYIIITIYYTTYNFLSYIRAFESFTQQIGQEYSLYLGKSLKESESIISQIISLFNRISYPLVLIITGIGTVILFFKKKIDSVLISLGLSGGIYLGIGLFFNILGDRAVQIFFIPITIGIMFFISKWKKPTIAFIIIILILSVFQPMRMAYDNTQFQLDEEANACNFLSKDIGNRKYIDIAINQVNYGYFSMKHKYLENTYVSVVRPHDQEFLDIFNGSLNQDRYVFYNSNLGKEVIISLLTKEQFNNRLSEIIDNNKIYDCGTTYIINGISIIL